MPYLERIFVSPAWGPQMAMLLVAGASGIVPAEHGHRPSLGPRGSPAHDPLWGASGPVRKFSVAALEQEHRRPGATIEFLSETPRGHTLISPVIALREIHGINATELQHVNTRRCGYSWDDAAAKCGSPCPRGHNEECSPHEPIDDGSHFWVGANYSCFDQLPVCDPLKPKGDCYSKNKLLPDAWCMERCGDVNFWCDRDNCVCEDDIPVNAPIEMKGLVEDPNKMPKRTMELRQKVMLAEATKPGLPECLWAPDRSCRNTSQYECVAGPALGRCSNLNWYGKPDCHSSCVHTSLLKPAPYYAVWRPGPVKPPLLGDNPEPLPHYAHNNMDHQLAWTRNFTKGDILMSRICQSKVNEFVGVTMYSPKYKDKAKRLINSCERVGVCCKATVLPPDVFGPDAPEGSEEFRFRAIAIKPAFILNQLRTTQLPVVYLDSDLEFHRFPELFQPGSWPNGDRDVLCFNFWANETNLTIRSIPNTASGVIFFNQTFTAQKVLTAWAEAMAYEKNVKAPDDQVLDELLVNGWLERASYGWLPSSYLHMMPAYYRGVKAVIDHDHGNAPGLTGHSSDKAVLPPIAGFESLKVGAVAGIKCLAVMEGGSDSWCTNSCNDPSGITNPSSTTCPTKLCVCDWKGDWKVEEEDDGEINWDDQRSLGVGGGVSGGGDGLPGGGDGASGGGGGASDAPEQNSDAAAIAKAVAKSLGAGIGPSKGRRPSSGASPAEVAETTATSFRATTEHAHRRVPIESSVASAAASAANPHGHGPKWLAKHGHGDDPSSGHEEDSSSRENAPAANPHGHGPKWMARYGSSSREEGRHKASADTTSRSI